MAVGDIEIRNTELVRKFHQIQFLSFYIVAYDKLGQHFPQILQEKLPPIMAEI